MRKFVIGDIHGRAKALKEVLVKARFDYEEDMLIVLGDVCDGGEEVKDVIDELLRIRNVVLILGNHDVWALEWMRTGRELPVWWNQGGIWTAKSYGFQIKNVPKSHIAFLGSAKKYHVEEGVLFVHGGFVQDKPIEEQSEDIVTWDRELIQEAKLEPVEGWKHVFVGHTPTQLMGNDIKVDDIFVPLTFNNLTMMDTGAGWKGRLSLMDIHTGEVWQSEMQWPIR